MQRRIERIPSLKRLLLQMRLDIAECQDSAGPDWDEELTLFEKLVVVLEDRRYLKHRGIDWPSVVRAAITRRGGASTIEMQFVRTVTRRYDRTLRRKLYEMIVARLLSFHISKLAILRGYLELAYMGHRLKGAEEASVHVFGQGIGELSREQTSSLAAMLVYPAPSDLQNSRWKAKVARRSKYGLSLLAKLEKGLEQPPG